MPNRFEHPEGEATRRASTAGASSSSQPPVAGANAGANVGRVKASRATWGAWRCASLASLALAGCVVANVAGCGGGGGGSTVVPTPQLASATILLLNTNGTGINGTVTLNGVTKNTTNSRAVFANLRPGSYPIVFTAAGVTTRTSIAVSGTGSQTFAVVPGLSNVSSNGIRVLGRTLLNTPATSTTSACTSASQPVTSALVIQVRSLNLIGRPIVSSIVRPASSDGRYVLFSIPAPGTYRVEARSLDSGSAPFAGSSASFTINQGQTQANLDICTNQSLNAPGGTPPPPPGTPTAGPGTGTPSATLTAMASITQTPGASATLTAQATPNPNATVDPNATSTPVGGVGVPTATPQGTPTNTPVPVPTNTPGPGTPTAVPTATPTTVGMVPPPIVPPPIVP